MSSFPRSFLCLLKVGLGKVTDGYTVRTLRKTRPYHRRTGKLSSPKLQTKLSRNAVQHVCFKSALSSTICSHIVSIRRLSSRHLHGNLCRKRKTSLNRKLSNGQRSTSTGAKLEVKSFSILKRLSRSICGYMRVSLWDWTLTRYRTAVLCIMLEVHIVGMGVNAALVLLRAPWRSMIGWAGSTS